MRESCRLQAREIASTAYLATFETATWEHHPSGTLRFVNGAVESAEIGDLDVIIHSTRDASDWNELIETARSILANLVELEALVAKDFDNTQEDGYFGYLEVYSPTEVDFYYCAAHCNSEWNEVLRRDASGAWYPFGIRQYSGIVPHKKPT